MCHLQKSLLPRLKSWIRRVVLDEEDASDLDKSIEEKPTLAEEATAAAKAAAAAAADVAKACQDMLMTKNEGVFLLNALYMHNISFAGY